MDAVNLIVTLVIFAILLGIAWWIITKIPAIGPSPNWIVQVIFGLVCLLIVIGIFFGGIVIPVASFKR